VQCYHMDKPNVFKQSDDYLSCCGTLMSTAAITIAAFLTGIELPRPFSHTVKRHHYFAMDVNMIATHLGRRHCMSHKNWICNLLAILNCHDETPSHTSVLWVRILVCPHLMLRYCFRTFHTSCQSMAHLLTLIFDHSL
jgi:hypothetical protein